MARTVHRLKITLRSVKPPVWRRIEVRSETKLSDLAAVLGGAMGWLGGHLHAFEARGARYGTPDPDWLDDDLDEGGYRLRDVLPQVGSRMRWDYDFGDGWQHDVVVEQITKAEPRVDYPVCLAGRRACPPEDCGGPWGYADMLDALADPSHPEHEEYSDWAPPGFDPAHFDTADANMAMRMPLMFDDC